MQCNESKQWGCGRFTNEDEDKLITRYDDIKDTNKVIYELQNLANVNEGASTKFKLVFNQHGNKDGINDIGVTNYSANEMLQILYDKGYRDITISDLACHGATAFHFKKIIKDFIKTDSTDSEVNVTIYAALEGRGVIPCDSNNGTKYRSIGTDGRTLKRDKTVYKSNLTSGEKEEHHPSNASIANSNIQNLASNIVGEKRSNVYCQSSDKTIKGQSTCKRQRL